MWHSINDTDYKCIITTWMHLTEHQNCVLTSLNPIAHNYCNEAFSWSRWCGFLESLAITHASVWKSGSFCLLLQCILQFTWSQYLWKLCISRLGKGMPSELRRACNLGAKSFSEILRPSDFKCYLKIMPLFCATRGTFIVSDLKSLNGLKSLNSPCTWRGEPSLATEFLSWDAFL